jgi:outer membrane protein, heavy metal efflux system
LKTPPFVAALAVLAVMAGPLAAQDPGSTAPIDLRGAVAAALTHDPRLIQARAGEREVAGRLRQAGALPNPMLEVTHEPLSGSGRSYSESYLTLSQRLHWPGPRSARMDRAAAELAAARARVEADSAAVVLEVKAAFVEAMLAGAVLRVIQGAEEDMDSALRAAIARESAGDLSTFELRRIEMEHRRYRLERLAAESRMRAAQTALGALVAPAGSERIAVGGAGAGDQLPGVPPDPSLDEGALQSAASLRPEVRAAEAAADAAGRAADAARGERLPEPTLMGGLKRQSDGLTGPYFGLSLPIPFWDRLGGEVVAAAAPVDAARAGALLAARVARVELAGALDRYRTRRASALVVLDTSPGDRELVEVARLAYEGGELDLLAFLDAVRASRESQELEWRARAELWMAYFELERAAAGAVPSLNDLGAEP